MIPSSFTVKQALRRRAACMAWSIRWGTPLQAWRGLCSAGLCFLLQCWAAFLICRLACDKSLWKGGLKQLTADTSFAMIAQARNSSYKGNSFEGAWLLEKRTKIVKDIKAAACSGKDEDKHNRNISLCLLGIGETLSFEAVQVSVGLSKQ